MLSLFIPCLYGQAWFARNNVDMIHSDFLNEHLSVIVLKKDKIMFTIVGVYLPYDDGKPLSLNEFNTSLCLSSELCEFYAEKGHVVMITGDLNADIGRGNRFDNLLEAFVTQNNYLLLDRHLHDVDHFTYRKGN